MLIIIMHSYIFQDSELNELRNTIEALKRQSGLSIPDPIISPNVGRRHTSPGMVLNSSPHHHHHHPLQQVHHHGGRAFHTLPMPTGNNMDFKLITVVLLFGLLY